MRTASSIRRLIGRASVESIGFHPNGKNFENAVLSVRPVEGYCHEGNLVPNRESDAAGPLGFTVGQSVQSSL
jgi:hypothetical protein